MAPINLLIRFAQAKKLFQWSANRKGWHFFFPWLVNHTHDFCKIIRAGLDTYLASHDRLQSFYYISGLLAYIWVQFNRARVHVFVDQRYLKQFRGFLSGLATLIIS